jgi:ABC-2 type transport system ATP-binding protein
MNLTIERGRITGLLGPNGSGKTTLIKMMNGLLTPTEGVIVIDGKEPGIETKAIVSYLPERTYLDAQKTVGDIIEFFTDFYEDFQPERAYGMLKSLNIDENAKLKTLSKGTKEKIQLILVMSRDASLYILDEPIAGVDPAARDYIIRTIINNYNPEASLLICTHLISDIENILDDVIFIKDGRMVEQTNVDTIRQQHGKTVDQYFREVFAC